MPEDAALANWNYMNPLELPALFYVARLIPHGARAVSAAAVSLAWAYLSLRIGHGPMHITYNHVMHRFAVFAASNGVVAPFWSPLAWPSSAPPDRADCSF